MGAVEDFIEAQKKWNIAVNSRLAALESKAHTHSVVTGKFPAPTTLTYVPTPTITRPNYLEPIVDPVWKTKITRISNTAGVRNAYAKIQPWNADSTKILLGYKYPGLLLDSSYKVIKSINQPSWAIWSNTNPSIIYGTQGTSNVFVSYNVDTGIQGTRTIAGFTSISIGDGEGNTSDDDSVVALITNTGVALYDIVNNKMLATRASSRPNNCTVSRSGNFVIITYNTVGSGLEQGTWLYSRSLQSIRQLSTTNYHADAAKDASGRDVWVQCSPTVKLFDMQDATKDRLLLAGTPAFVQGHISGRNTKRDGYVYLSEYLGTTTNPGADQVVALKLDGSGTVEVFAHSHHRGENYPAMPFAVPNRDGSKVMFGSEWGGTEVYAYVAEMI